MEFSEKIKANNFALSDAEDNTSGTFTREGIADLLLLGKLLVIRQKLQGPSFCEMTDLFMLLA